MKEQIHTIPVNEAFEAGDECPFCFLERATEQRIIRFVIGPAASYMEPDVRDTTDKAGFCGAHTKKLYDFGNPLGNALILQSHYAGLLDQLFKEEEAGTPPPKRGLFSGKKPAQTEEKPLWQKIRERGDSCYICSRLEDNMERYFHTFFVLLKEEQFRQKVLSSKGFCLRHYARLMEQAGEQVPNSQRDWFYREIPALEKENLIRVKEDLDWMVAKYDYRNATADWKNSRDALQRTMQKLRGIYPADPPFTDK